MADVVNRLRQAKNTRYAEQIQQRLIRSYPNSYPALLLQADNAYDSDDIERARKLVEAGKVFVVSYDGIVTAFNALPAD